MISTAMAAEMTPSPASSARVAARTRSRALVLAVACQT